MKRALFIAPTFFGYYKDIIGEFKKRDYQIFYFNDRPSEKLFTKAIIRINKTVLRRKINKYVNFIIKSIEGEKIDLVFIILGQSFSRENILKIKKAHPEAEFVYYSWDSVKNFPNILEFRDCFDRVYHFDSRDAKEYGFNLLPLYYSNKLKEENPIYSFSAVFTVKRGKLKKFQKIMEVIPNDVKKDAFIYLYLQSRFVFWFYKLRYKEFRKSHAKDFKFKKIAKEEYYEIMAKSRVIIDVQMKSQSGLTMRTFETLHARKKLITTNPNVLDYEFYSPNNICVINKNYNDLSPTFFETQFDRTYDVSKKYSLPSFIDTILGENNS